MAASVEVIGFEAPSDENKTLFVRGIPRHLPREEKWASLHAVFFRHGLIYNVSLPQSPYNQDLINDNSEATPTAPHSISMETEYGFVTFYSRQSALSALTHIKNTPTQIGNHSLKVELARPRTTKPHSLSTSLYISKCWDLCNYHLGFNGWSVRIITMENLENSVGVWVGVQCRVEVTVRGCEEGESCGLGEWRGEGGEEEGSPADKLRARGAARKRAFNRACEDAFSHILLILIPGRPTTAMIVDRPEDHVRRLVGDLVSTCPPVTMLPCQPDDDCIIE